MGREGEDSKVMLLRVIVNKITLNILHNLLKSYDRLLRRTTMEHDCTILTTREPGNNRASYLLYIIAVFPGPRM